MGKEEEKKEEKKVKKSSKLLLRLTVIILLMITAAQSYIIFKSRKYIKELTGEESVIEFAEKEFNRDKENIEKLFDKFLKDTAYKGKPLSEIKKEGVARQVEPMKEKFEKWYAAKFSNERISHNAELKGSKIIVTVSIPGVRKESVDITVHDETINLSGRLNSGEYFTHSLLVPKKADAKSSKVDFDAGPNKINIIFKLK